MDSQGQNLKHIISSVKTLITLALGRCPEATKGVSLWARLAWGCRDIKTEIVWQTLASLEQSIKQIPIFSVCNN